MITVWISILISHYGKWVSDWLFLLVFYVMYELDPKIYASTFTLFRTLQYLFGNTPMTQLIFASDPHRCNVMEYPDKLTAPNIVLFSCRAMPEAEF